MYDTDSSDCDLTCSLILVSRENTVNYVYCIYCVCVCVCVTVWYVLLQGAVVSSQTLTRQFSDNKGNTDNKSWSHKPSSTSGAHLKPSTPKITVPNVISTPLKNTSENSSPQSGSIGNKPAAPQASSRPVKVNGGPGGSLTSEDSTYSGSSDESPERGEQRNQTPQPSVQTEPARQMVDQPQVVTPSGWQGRPLYVTAHSTDGQIKAVNPKPMTGKTSTGRESPYLVPQLPRDPSSQQEDDWPGFESTKKVLTPDPASSTLLAAMRSPPQPQLHSIPLRVPGREPTMVSGTFERMPLPPHAAMFRSFGPHFQMMLPERPNGNHDIPVPQGTSLVHLLYFNVCMYVHCDLLSS